jgi:hypothetical protein
MRGRWLDQKSARTKRAKGCDRLHRVFTRGLTAAAHEDSRKGATLDCNWAISSPPIPIQARPSSPSLPRPWQFEMFDALCTPDGRHARTVAPTPHAALPSGTESTDSSGALNPIACPPS